MNRLSKGLASEEGAIMPMVVVLFLTMVVMSGMAVDFMRHEAARADLQNALDRGVLAATALTQTLAQKEAGKSDAQLAEEKKELILSYMKSRTFRSSGPVVEVSIPDDLEDYESAVSASATYSMDTFFLKVAGFGQLEVPARSYAEQRRLDVEVALVLDVSGSMLLSSAVPVDPGNPGGEKKIRLEAMKDAVTEFASNLFNDQSKGQTLVSVVPYTSNTSANAFMAQHYELQPVKDFLALHDYSYCFQFDVEGSGSSNQVKNNPDYSMVEIRRGSGTHQHVQQQHFPEASAWQGSTYFDGEHRYGCPLPVNRILPYADNAADVTNMVAAMEAENFTATYSGVKWGAALLDTSSQSLVTAMVDHTTGPTDPRASEALDASYDGWPRDFDVPTTRKYLIIMSDGRNTRQKRIVRDADYYTPTPGATEAELADEQAARLSQWNEAWSYDSNDGLVDAQDVVNTLEGDTLNKMTCDAIKAKAGDGNLTVFTIAYALSDDDTGNKARNVLQDCASDAETDFFDIGAGDDPSVAFDAIQTRLTLLKLAQSTGG